jgi:hypothetical protein
MRFTFDYKTLHLSPTVWKRLLDQELNAALTQGAIIWMNAALSRIPVWSGASHGTFLKLAATIGYSISVGGGVPWMSGPNYGKSHSSARKTIYDGAYVLEYTTDLWHLCYNEISNANTNPEEGRLFARLKNPGPYAFQELAAEEFRQYAKSVRLPPPLLAITIKTHTVK